jgi:hypothetical protein
VKTLLIQGEKNFKIVIQDDDQITFGPWSPPNGEKSNGYHQEGGKRGTLRIYRGSKQNIIACFSGVYSFRDMSMGYAEEVAKEEGATLWKSDEHGYQREEKVSARKEWVGDPVVALPATVKKSRKR